MKKSKKVKINCQKGGTYNQMITDGYKDDSPFNQLPEITIPGNRITMKGVSQPIKAQLSNGQTHIMQPGQEYYFPGTDYVKESPYYQSGGPIVQKPIDPSWYQIPTPPVQPPVQSQVPFQVNHEGVNKMKSKNKIYEKQEGGMIQQENQPQQFDQQVLGSYVRSLAPREQSQFIEQWKQMDEAQKQELYQAIVQQSQGQPEMQEGGFVHPYDTDFYPEMQSGGAPIWNNLNATAYARNYRPTEVQQAAAANTQPVVTQANPTQEIPVAVAQKIVAQGSDVTRIQQALVDAGYKIKVDGVYGPKTQRAVELYQAANKLKVDGVTGKNTLNSLGLNYIDKTFKNTITRKAPVIKKQETQVKEVLDENGMPVVPEIIDENGMPVETQQLNYYTPINESKYYRPETAGVKQPVVNQENPWWHSLPSGQAQRPNSVLPMSAAAAVNQERPYNPDDPREVAFRETMGIPMSLVPLGGSSVAKGAAQAGNYVAKNASKVMPAFEQLGSTASKYSNSIKTSLSEMLPKGTTYDTFFKGGPSNVEKLVDYMVKTGKVAKSEGNKLIGELSQYFRTAKPSSSDYSQFFK